MKLDKPFIAQQVELLVGLYRLQLPFKFASKSFGQSLVNKRGASLDFLEHRAYSPGDDYRTIDWRASAKGDQLVVKTFHDEISPIVEVVLDLSLSMGHDEQKWTQYIVFLGFLIRVCQSDGFSVKVWCLGEKMELLKNVKYEDIFSLKTQAGFGMQHVLKRLPQFAPSSIRFILSDFMIAEGVREIVEKCLRLSSIGMGIQLLPSFEINPTVGAGLKLLDAETGHEINVRLTEDVCDQYKQRFNQHTKVLNTAFSRHRGTLVASSCEEPSTALFEKILSKTNLFVFR